MNKKVFSITKDYNKKKQSRLNITLLGIKFRFTQENIFKFINTKEEFRLYIAGLRIRKYKYKNLYKKMGNAPEELDLLKKVIDVNSVKSTPGRITDFHKAYGYYLKVVTSILEEHDLTYWIDFGTLLGAVRHKGFIPWDDDTDITMFRDDYHKAISILKERLAPYGFRIWEGGIKYCNLTRILYKCFQVDIFPVDLYYKKVETQEEIKRIDKKMKTARDLFFNKFYEIVPCPAYTLPHEESTYPREALIKILKDILLENHEQIRGGSILRNFEFIHDCPNVFQYNDVFPLQKIQFEDEYFYAPNRLHEYLHSVFGDYEKFPEHCCPHVNIEKRIEGVDFSYETEFLKNILRESIQK